MKRLFPYRPVIPDEKLREAAKTSDAVSVRFCYKLKDQIAQICLRVLVNYTTLETSAAQMCLKM